MVQIVAYINININTDTVQPVKCASHQQKILAAPDLQGLSFLYPHRSAHQIGVFAKQICFPSEFGHACHWPVTTFLVIFWMAWKTNLGLFTVRNTWKAALSKNYTRILNILQEDKIWVSFSFIFTLVILFYKLRYVYVQHNNPSAFTHFC